MTPDEQVSGGPEIASRAEHHRGRELAKLVGAIAFVLASGALVCRLLWVTRHDGPAQTAAASGGLLQSDAPGAHLPFGELAAPRPGSADAAVLSPEIAGLVARAGIVPGTGQMAAPLLFGDGEGTVGSLEQHRGKVVLIAFWGPTCAPCIAELPELEELAERHEKSEFVVLPVCTDDTNAAKARDVAARVAPRLRVYVDSDGSGRNAYHVHHLPQAFLVDRGGRVVGRSYGNVRWAGKDVDLLLAACLRGPISLTAEEDDAR
jgi:thiol-disulfide isomerase/thioredoxin